MRGLAGPAIAGIFALAAFAVAMIAGLGAGNPASTVILRAILAMLLCYPLGLSVGLVCNRLIQDHISAHRETHPAPEVVSAPRRATSAPAESDDVIVV